MGEATQSPLCLLALQIWEWCQSRKITPHAEYLPGRDNTEADWESRHHQDSSDWQLLPSVFRALNKALGPFNVDLFASRTNAQLEQYYSWKPDPAAKVVDAFSVSWAHIPVPSFQPHRESLDQDPNGSGRVCLPYSTSVASTSLVSSGAGDVIEGPNSPPNEFRSSQESRPDSAPSLGRGADVLNRMAYLRQGFFMQGFYQHAPPILEDPHTLSIQLSLEKIHFQRL